MSVPKVFRPYLSNPPAGKRKCPSSLEAKTPLIGDPELAQLDLMMPGRLCSTFLVFSVSSDYLKARQALVSEVQPMKAVRNPEQVEERNARVQFPPLRTRESRKISRFSSLCSLCLWVQP